MALTIQTKNKTQYYAPLENVEDLIIPFLKYIVINPIQVIFEVDFTKFYGEVRGKNDIM